MQSIIKGMNWNKDYKKIFLWAVGSIILLKVVLMGLFSSDYQDKMFIPFVSTFVNCHLNPYEYYYINQQLPSFPYPPLMLLVESVGGCLLSAISPDIVFWRNFIFKLPLLIFDCLGLGLLWKITKSRNKYVLILYFLSPINLYATYIHGQLDIIPTVLLLAAIYFLAYSNKTYSMVCFSLLFSMALATKLHILAVMPIVFMYLYKKRGIKTTAIFVTVIMLCFVVITLPFLCEGLIYSAFFSKEQHLLFQVFLDYGTVKLIIPIVVVVLIYLKVFELQHMNGQLLICLTGVLFVIFLVCVPPMPGWFVWVIPFITLYFQSINENKHKMLIIYLAFNLLYIVYFVLCHQTAFVDIYALGHSLQMLKIGNNDTSSLVFTVMTGCLIVLVAEMYRLGVASNSFYKRRNFPFTIGIAGDSGTGKSELLKQIENLLGKKSIQYIEGDGDHRWQRGSTEWEQYTHLDPKANYLYRQAKDIATLREGGIVKRTDYDHETGKFTQMRKIAPKQYIILCGLHSLYLPQTRAALDLKIYMDTDEALRRFWKIERDTQSRGYTDRQIIEQIEKRIPDAIKYIYPQRDFADLSIRYVDKTMKDYCDLSHQVCISVDMSIDVTIDVESVINDLIEKGIRILHVYSDDLKHQIVSVDGTQLQGVHIPFQEIAGRNIPQLEELLYHPIVWSNGIDGVVQLFILIIICAKMRGDA